MMPLDPRYSIAFSVVAVGIMVMSWFFKPHMVWRILQISSLVTLTWASYQLGRVNQWFYSITDHTRYVKQVMHEISELPVGEVKERIEVLKTDFQFPLYPDKE